MSSMNAKLKRGTNEVTYNNGDIIKFPSKNNNNKSFISNVVKLYKNGSISEDELLDIIIGYLIIQIKLPSAELVESVEGIFVKISRPIIRSIIEKGSTEVDRDKFFSILISIIERYSTSKLAEDSLVYKNINEILEVLYNEF